jgi:membrane protein DedA with SNARE-associated domain
MLESLVRHGFVAVLLAVMIEELGIPMPIPTDVLIVFAGTVAGQSVPRLTLFFVMLTVASAVGASGLYAIVRRGGRPLVAVRRERILQVTEQTSSGTRQTALSVRQLTLLTEELRNSVSRFKIA